MKSNYLLIGVIIILLIVVAVLASRTNESRPAEVSSSSGTQTTEGVSEGEMSEPIVVHYTDTGFEPQVVFIGQGIEVSFVNDTDSALFVAANNHPTHELLSGFTQGRSGGKGVTYTYLFTDVGLWGYHNHNKTTDVGAVVVRQ